MGLKYAGIGSRSTPLGILCEMTRMATNLELCGFTLRSGGAQGADNAFEKGVKNPAHKEIFLPWRLFNNNTSGRYIVGDDAIRMAAHFHPAWHNCSHAARKLHGRNSYIIMGENLDDPVDFVLCYTPNGNGKGGTGQGMRIAMHYGIPVFDLGKDEYWDKEFNDLVVELLQQPADFQFIESAVDQGDS